MSKTGPPGFDRSEIKGRYDIAAIDEDEWHSFEDRERRVFVTQALSSQSSASRWLLNAGAGVHDLKLKSWDVIPVDLFPTPLGRRRFSVCCSIAALPFPNELFGAVVCMGEVLGYCDPAQAIDEFSRILEPGGMLICDYGSTRSIRHLFTSVHGRAAHMVTIDYNEEPERIWIFDPSYIASLLDFSGFVAVTEKGICGWAATFQRIGIATPTALKIETALRRVPFSARSSDVTIVAARRI